MDDEEKKDLKEDENGTQEEKSDSENDSADSDGLKKEEDSKAKAEKLLDGTEKNKKITVKKSTFDDRNDKAKIYEAHAELLDQVLKDPDTVQRFLKGKDTGDVESRLAAMEAHQKAEKRAQMRETLAGLISEYPDFEGSWGEVEPIANELMKKGHSVKTSLRRAYIAVHPEAAEHESKRLADDAFNREGEVRGGGLAIRTAKGKKELSESERGIAGTLIRQGVVKSEEDYAKMLDKHDDWIQRQMRNIGE